MTSRSFVLSFEALMLRLSSMMDFFSYLFWSNCSFLSIRYSLWRDLYDYELQMSSRVISLFLMLILLSSFLLGWKDLINCWGLAIVLFCEGFLLLWACFVVACTWCLTFDGDLKWLLFTISCRLWMLMMGALLWEAATARWNFFCLDKNIFIVFANLKI